MRLILRVALGLMCLAVGFAVFNMKELTQMARKFYNYQSLSKEELLAKAVAFTGTQDLLLYHNHCTGQSGFSFFQPWGDMVLVTDVDEWDFEKTKEWMWNDKMDYCDVFHPYLAIVWEQEGKRFEAMWSFAKDDFTFEKRLLWLDTNQSQDEDGIFEHPQYFLSSQGSKNDIGIKLKQIATQIVADFYAANPLSSVFKPTDTLIVYIDSGFDTPLQKRVLVGNAINNFFTDVSLSRGRSTFAKVHSESIHSTEYWIQLHFSYVPDKSLYATSLRVEVMGSEFRVTEISLKQYPGNLNSRKCKIKCVNTVAVINLNV